ncbi:carbohydrate kinase family protein [Natronobacterium gregoryi]|uniref:PfkB domain-containing protein n=2 Tax=Natronobacterium gregoryi TaxID=44930 RepID=L0AGS0_NATGS|nr:PfkB family carbohydrate kinase [Natronobacterium gregoryi]AFZ72362.1 sugar kinase, ribokinase [Natronobacterium gregoryi SP2]ELY64253.1 PfkB domain-containing protein [Natronobacterium gregoryi SP2]PLK20323.1 sugar kinase [Natronobacterium gregoryi SP2]SFJ22354.1 ribokinase [Natronobacterium gregoryi]
MITVLTAGHVNWDVTLRVDRLPEPDGESAIRSQSQSGGGSAANVAAALAGLEVDAGLVGSVGDDDNGVLARRDLEAAGVSLEGLRVVDDAETAVKYLLVDDEGEVAVLGNDGVNEAVAPDDVDSDRIRSADHVHLTSQRPDTATRIAEIASDAGVTISFDPGRRLEDREYGNALALADILFANDREIASLLEGEYEHVGSEYGDRIVVVKHGGDGAKLHTPELTYDHPGFDVEPVDTAGAGDAFAAGFLAVALTDGDLERALEYANACGALTASKEGARSAPTATTVEKFLRSQY